MARETLTHLAVAEQLYAVGFHDGDLPGDDQAFAFAIVKAFDRTPVRIGSIPTTPADFDEIRLEHRLLCERSPAVRTVTAWVQ